MHKRGETCALNETNAAQYRKRWAKSTQDLLQMARRPDAQKSTNGIIAIKALKHRKLLRYAENDSTSDADLIDRLARKWFK